MPNCLVDLFVQLSSVGNATSPLRQVNEQASNDPGTHPHDNAAISI